MYILLDEAFIDYVPEHSLTTAASEFANLIVFRSVTKFHGMPGLRVAYAVGNPALSASVSANLSPWPITTLASRAVSAALNDRSHAVRARTENLTRRIALHRDLNLLELPSCPSAANFVLFRLPSRADPDAFWRSMIVEHHMVLRACANFEALPQGHFRAAVRTQQENGQLAAAIAKSLSHDRILTSSACSSARPLIRPSHQPVDPYLLGRALPNPTWVGPAKEASVCYP